MPSRNQPSKKHAAMAQIFADQTKYRDNHIDETPHKLRSLLRKQTLRSFLRENSVSHPIGREVIRHHNFTNEPRNSSRDYLQLVRKHHRDGHSRDRCAQLHLSQPQGFHADEPRKVRLSVSESNLQRSLSRAAASHHSAKAMDGEYGHQPATRRISETAVSGNADLLLSPQWN